MAELPPRQIRAETGVFFISADTIPDGDRPRLPFGFPYRGAGVYSGTLEQRAAPRPPDFRKVWSDHDLSWKVASVLAWIPLAGLLSEGLYRRSGLSPVEYACFRDPSGLENFRERRLRRGLWMAYQVMSALATGAAVAYLPY